MTIEQITALVNAGFTKDEIMAMTAPAQEPAAPEQEPQTAQEPTQQTAQEPAQQTAQEPAQQTAQEPAQPEYTNADVMKELASLKSIMQAQNLASSFIPQVTQKDAAAVLAEVIRPERKV